MTLPSVLICVIHGPVAQLVARFVRNEEVTGSIPVRSTYVNSSWMHYTRSTAGLAVQVVVLHQVQRKSEYLRT